MKAVIEIDGRQELVSKGDKLAVDGKLESKELSYDAIMLVDGDKSKVGTPMVTGLKVKAKVVGEQRSEKVTSIRYKAKKRVNKKYGHRQDQTIIEITSVN